MKTTLGHDVETCRAVLVDGMADMGCEVVVSTAPPLTSSVYDYNPMRCRHGTVFWMQPTNDQILRWQEAGTR